MIDIRDARPEDAEMVAWAVLTALDMPADELARVTQSTSKRDSLYSWTNALVAEVDGRPAGCIVSYGGDHYDTLRRKTWPEIWPEVTQEYIDGMTPETEPGEYYLDSMALREEFRGLGIGKKLMLAAMQRGSRGGYENFSLLVDVDKPRLKEYYSSLDFRPEREIMFLGHPFCRMIRCDREPRE